MKYTILFFAAVGLLFAACKKKQSSVGCYTCVTVSVQHSNNPLYDTVKPTTTSGNLCNYNSGEIAFYIKTHTGLDTVLNTGGTLVTQNKTVTCTAQ